MNKQRRKRIANIVGRLRILQGHFDNIKDELEDVLGDEEEAFDNMPESLQYSERGETSQECIDVMTEAVDEFDEVMDKIQEVIDTLSEKSDELSDITM